MEIKNCEGWKVETALENLNDRYADNIVFSREGLRLLNKAGTRSRVRLAARDHGAGESVKYRLNLLGVVCRRHSRDACWHVYGHFFEELFKVCPGAIVSARGRTITAQAGNWQDYNVGSVAYPVYASKQCGCNVTV